MSKLDEKTKTGVMEEIKEKLPDAHAFSELPEMVKSNSAPSGTK